MKLISLLLSFTLIFTSVAPSFAQAVQSRPPAPDISSINTAAMERRIVEQVDALRVASAERDLVTNFDTPTLHELKEMQSYLWILEQDEKDIQQEEENDAAQDYSAFVQTYNEEVNAIYRQELSNSQKRKEFKKAYKRQVQAAYQKYLKETTSSQDRDELRQWRDDLLSATHINKAYEDALKEWRDTTLKADAVDIAYLQAQKAAKELAAAETKKLIDHLKELGRKALKYERPIHVYGPFLVKDPLSEVLPVFASVGAIDSQVRIKASAILRKRIEEKSDSCKGNLSKDKQKVCVQVLQDVAALAILGTEREDAWAIARVLEKGYNGTMGVNVVNMVGGALVSMDDVPEAADALTRTIALIAKQYPVSAWDIATSIISVEGWVEFAQNVAQDGPFAEGYENSFYQSEDKKLKNLENVWINLGIELAQKAQTDAHWRSEIDSLVNNTLIQLQKYGDRVGVGTQHNLLLTGLLYGKYQVHLNPGLPQQELDANGRIHVVDRRPAVAIWNRQNQTIGISQTEALALRLYFAGTADLDPWTARYVKNLLCHAFEANGKKAKGVFVRGYATQEEISSFNNWNDAKKIGFIADIAIIIWAVWKIAPSVVSFFKHMTRITKMARAAAAAGQAANTAQAWARIARLARFYKYGTTSITEIMRGSARTAAAGISRSGFTFKEIKLPTPPKAIIKPKPVSAPAPTTITGTTIALDDALHIVPDGMRYVRVGRNLELVDASKTLEAIAADFQVEASAVREVQAGESLVEAVVTPQYSYSTGDGLLGSTGSQPVMAPSVADASITTAAPEPATALHTEQAPRWVQTKSLNALGQWVDSWRPVQPEPIWRKPSLSWKDRLLSVRLETNDFLRGIGRMVRTRVGALNFALATSTGYVPMEAVALDRAALLGEPIHITMQPMISQEAMRISAIPTDFSKGMNAGAMTATRAAQTSLTTTRTAQGTTGVSRSVLSRMFKADGLAQLGQRMLRSNQNPGMLPWQIRALTTPSGMIPLTPQLNDPQLLGDVSSAATTTSHAPRGMRTVELARTPTLWQKFLFGAVVPFYPKMMNTSLFKRIAGPMTDTQYYRYERVAYNPRTKQVHRLTQNQPIEAGEEVFTVAQKYFFVAPRQVDEDAIAGNIFEKMAKEANANGRELDEEELNKAIQKALAQIKEAVAIAARRADDLAGYVLSNPLATREDLIWVMASAANVNHKMRAVNLLKEKGYAAATLDEVIARRVELDKLSYLNVKLKKDELHEIEARVITRINEENQGELVPQDDPLLIQGLTRQQLTNVDQSLLTQALMPTDGLTDLLHFSTSEKANGNIIYDQVLPVYIRTAEGNVSSEPRLYLLLNKPFEMPRGFRAILDESGHFKVSAYNLREVQSTSSLQPYNAFWKFIYKHQPDFLDKLPWVKNNPRRLLNWDSSSRRRVFETPLKASELAALNYTLATHPKQAAVLTTAQTDQFETLMMLVALIAGADLGASLSSQLKKTFSLESAVVFVSGFGYLSPLLANIFKSAIKKYGYYTMIRGGLFATLIASGIGMFNGMTGTFDPASSGMNLALAVGFMATAIITASVFSTLSGQVLKSAYSDPTVFSSKNMAFTTTKGLSRLGVTLGTAAIIGAADTLLGWDLNWSVLVPVMGVLSLLGLRALKNSRLAGEHRAMMAQKQKEQAARQNKKKDEALEREQARAAAAQEALHKQQMHDKYQSVFAKPLTSITTRLGFVYLSYAVINSVIIGVLAGMLYDSSTALTIGAGGLFISWLIRKVADKMIKSRVITEDQLTGMSLPLMLGGVTGALFSPFGSPAMLASWLLMYLSTPTFGVSENTRMMNYVASYYKNAREEVNANPNLSAKEKEERLKELNAEQQEMKAEAGAAYNKYNSWGLYPILTMLVLVAFAKDMVKPDLGSDLVVGVQNLWDNYIGSWLQSTHTSLGDWFYQAGTDIGHTLHQAGSGLKHVLQPIGQSIGEWIQQAADALRIGGADDPIALGPKVTEKKIADAPLDYSIYRLSMFAPLIFATILNWMNKGMIKQGLQRVVKSIHLTPEMIQDHPEKIADELQIDFSREEDFVNEIKKEVEELDASIRPFVNSRTSEERLQSFANRLVWVNNRLKAAVSHSEFLATALSVELGMMKSLSDVFMSVVDFNDVSDGLRSQAVSLYDSLSAIEVNGPSTTKTSADKLLQFLDKLQHAAAYKNSTEFNSLVTMIFRDVRSKNPQTLREHLTRLQPMVSAKKDLRQLTSLGNAAVRSLAQAQRQRSASRFVYLPEVKLSFVDVLLRNLRIVKDPAKGIFSGMDVQEYEQAKLLQRELEHMLQEAQNGQIVNGMFEQFENFYQRAINCLKAYVRNNRNHVSQMDTRVNNMKADLDKLYVQYMGKQPPTVSFEQEASVEMEPMGNIAPQAAPAQ